MPPKLDKTGAQPTNYPNTRLFLKTTGTDTTKVVESAAVIPVEGEQHNSTEDPTNVSVQQEIIPVEDLPQQEEQEPSSSSINLESNNINLQNNSEELSFEDSDQIFAMANFIMLPHFSDASSNVPSSWWNMFESYKICHNMSDERAIASLTFHLIGQAKSWFTSLDAETRNDMNRLKAAFLARFPNKSTNNQIFHLQQGAQESGHEYITRVQQLAVSVDDISERAIVQLAINGMKSDIKYFVVGREPKSFEELRHSIELATSVANCQAQNNVNVNTCNLSNTNSSNTNSSNLSASDINTLCLTLADSLKSMVRQEVMALAPQSQSQNQYGRNRQSQSQSCRGCGKSCKVRKHCPAFRAKCFYCERIGHYKEVCEQKQREQTPNPRIRHTQNQHFNSRH